jgi:lysophospholipase L1-like esterase
LRRVRQTALPIMGLVALLCAPAIVRAQAQLACPHFTQEPAPPPAPRTAESAVRRFELINAEVKTVRHRVLYLGDSLTERWNEEVWRAHMEPRGVLNAGVNGDRTEHLLWRLQHGNLTGPPPLGVIVLIGTNDLTNGGSGRPPDLVAEGIRADLTYLRQHLPGARILLLGLWPREDVPRLRPKIPEVNRLIQNCGDGQAVVYADLGGILLDAQRRLTREIAPDLLHLSRLGYERLAPKLDALIDNLVADR